MITRTMTVTGVSKQHDEVLDGDGKIVTKKEGDKDVQVVTNSRRTVHFESAGGELSLRNIPEAEAAGLDMGKQVEVQITVR